MADKIEWHPNGTPGPWEIFADMRTDGMYTDEYLAGWNIESTDGEIVGIEGIVPSDTAETNARAIAEVPAMVQANRATNAHLELMQAAVIEHLKPDGDLVDKDAFINRIIYLLDGPEQRALQDSVRAILARIDKDA